MPKNKIGIIGSGRLGTALARLLSNAGYEVSIINSKSPDSLKLQLKVLLPKVTARKINELIAWSDIIILALPLREYTTLSLDKMSGKIIIDAMNYWAGIDGKIPEFEKYAGSSSELVAKSLPNSRVIKTLNSVAYNELEEHSAPKRTMNRRAIPLAGDDESAKAIVCEIIDNIGFDPVDLGPLSRGRLFQPDTNLFNTRLNHKQVTASYFAQDVI
ncbi:MAG: coenzyme F420-dependent oxidoreductase [Candidatus Saccharibacteria bacterium]|nr:coenzyme F420-dependent oxidoreductase [Candidatus Saccharibacteria bacterium]